MIYSLPQRCAVIVLATRGGEAPNTVLGFKLEKSQRDRLETDGLISVSRRARPMTLRLTDKGWQAFDDEIVSEPPPRAGSAGRALYAALHAIGGLLGDRPARDALRGMSAGAITSTPPQKVAQVSVSDENIANRQPTHADDVEVRVRAAYRSLAKKSRDWVELSDLRAALSDLSREAVDANLARMLHGKEIEMSAHEDRGSLTKAQRQSALRIGRIDMHLISVRD